MCWPLPMGLFGMLTCHFGRRVVSFRRKHQSWALGEKDRRKDTRYDSKRGVGRAQNHTLTPDQPESAAVASARHGPNFSAGLENLATLPLRAPFSTFDECSFDAGLRICFVVAKSQRRQDVRHYARLCRISKSMFDSGAERWSKVHERRSQVART